MKTLLLLLLIIMFSGCEKSQENLSEIENSTSASNQFDYAPGSISVELDPSSLQKGKEEYRIVFNRDGKNWPIIFFTYNMEDFTEEDKIEVITDLLELKGDLRVSSEKVVCRSIKLSSLCNSNSERVSIQLEALYRINEIILPDFFREYSPLPVLIDKKNKRRIFCKRIRD